MRRLLTLFVLAIMISGIASAGGKRERGANEPPRYTPRSFETSIVQIEQNVDGEIWMIVGYRTGTGYWLQALPLLPVETINYMRSIYDGPDPTTGYTSDDDDEKDEPEVDGLEIHGNGVTIRPKGGGSSTNDD